MGVQQVIDGEAAALHTAIRSTNEFRDKVWIFGGHSMKLEWHKPEVTEQEVGLEVTSYASAELDRG